VATSRAGLRSRSGYTAIQGRQEGDLRFVVIDKAIRATGALGYSGRRTAGMIAANNVAATNGAAPVLGRHSIAASAAGTNCRFSSNML
jgi:hypothetical protein